MKNILTIFLTFVITITLLSGCANNIVDNDNNMKTSTSKKQKQPFRQQWKQQQVIMLRIICPQLMKQCCY